MSFFFVLPPKLARYIRRSSKERERERERELFTIEDPTVGKKKKKKKKTFCESARPLL